jgi:hypothetical protein
MNERIKELNAQADKYAWEKVGKKYDGTGDLNWQWEDTKMEKFAELIIRECAELTLDHKNDDYYAGWLDYRDEIKKHFGVQE